MKTRTMARGLAAGAFAAAMIATAGVSSASAEQAAENCVVNVETGNGVCDDSAARAEAAAAYVLVRFWNGYDYTGATLTLTGGHRCKTPLDPEYYHPNLGNFGWNNRASSVIAYNNCVVKLYDLPGLRGASSRWLLSWSNLGTIGWNNRATSVRVS